MLALDLGQHIGWVKGRGLVGPIESGSFRLDQTTDLGAWLASSDKFFQIAMQGVTSIAVEDVFMGENINSGRKLLSLLGHMAWHANRAGVGWEQIHRIANSTGKKKLTGHGHAEKDDMILAAMRWGLDNPDQHEADALGIFLVHIDGADLSKPTTRRSGPGKIIKPRADS